MLTTDRTRLALLCAVVTFAVPVANAATVLVALAGTGWERAAQPRGLDPLWLYALALARTGTVEQSGAVAPWPWTLNSGGQQRHYTNQRAVTAALAQARRVVGTDLEIGIMGISLSRWGHRVRDPAILVDPDVNVRLAADILGDSVRANPDDLEVAIGYFAASDPTAARAFGRRVLRIAATLGMVPPASLPRALVPPLITAAARRYGLDPAFVLAIASVESAFKQSRTSRVGARGVMQLMPTTAARYHVDPADLAQNIDGGARYLRDLALLFRGDPALVAAAYNAGEHAVLRYGRQIPPYPETQQYVPRVMAARESFGCPRR